MRIAPAFILAVFSFALRNPVGRTASNSKRTEFAARPCERGTAVSKCASGVDCHLEVRWKPPYTPVGWRVRFGVCDDPVPSAGRAERNAGA